MQETFRRQTGYPQPSFARSKQTSSGSLKMPQAAPSFFRVLATIERRYSDVTLALCAESASRRNNNVQIIQHMIEHLPARHLIRRFYPNVGRVRPTKHL